MEVQATELLEFLSSINFHHLRLVVQLIPLCKTVTAWLIVEAPYSPKVLGQLSKSVQGQLVKLHMKLN
jgi:hypothetical protein